MNWLGALGGDLLVFATALGLMHWALLRRRDGGLFAALPLGLLPAIAATGLLFWQLQQQDTPEIKQVRQEWAQRSESWAAARFPKAEDAPLREELRRTAQAVFEVLPALEFGFRLVLLAAMAAYLRRRQARLGLAAEPEPLSRWTAPFGLVWLVVGPVFWLMALRHHLVEAPMWASRLAWNVLTVGLGLYLFQGLVVFGAKLAAWSRDPRTRALTPLVLAAAAASLLVQDGRGLLVFLVLTGLFDPWVDLRRLNAPKPEEGGDAGKD